MIDQRTDFHALFGLPSQGVSALCTTRWLRPKMQRVSLQADQDFNLAAYASDDPQRVLINRALLLQQFDLPAEPLWLDQVHGTQIHRVVESKSSSFPPVADGATTRLQNQVLAVLTADCLPLILATKDGAQVAAVHVGWRGLASGIIGVAVDCFDGAPLVAWIGPGIGPCHFEVGPELKEKFSSDLFAAGRPPDRVLLDLPQAAQRDLASAGVSEIKMSGVCTVCSVNDFYSYRQEGVTGRFATLVWRESR
ncbi:MAG: peptidoglycan editing factor PgeF [Pseudomonadales bacterium]